MSCILARSLFHTASLLWCTCVFCICAGSSSLLLPGQFFLRDFLGVVFVHDPRHVSPSLVEWRNAAILFDSLGTRVIGGEGLHKIKVVALEKFAQITAAARNIRLRIESVYHTKLIGRTRH